LPVFPLRETGFLFQKNDLARDRRASGLHPVEVDAGCGTTTVRKETSLVSRTGISIPTSPPATLLDVTTTELAPKANVAHAIHTKTVKADSMRFMTIPLTRCRVLWDLFTSNVSI